MEFTTSTRWIWITPSLWLVSFSLLGLVLHAVTSQDEQPDGRSGVVANISRKSLYQDDLCEKVSSCSARYSITYDRNANCQCDALCHLYDDCCFDINFAIGEQSSQPGFNYDLSCDYFDGNTMYMVRRCPNTFQGNDTRNKCEVTGTLSNIREQDALLYVPTSDKKTGMTFKNVFCSVCNGMMESELTYWTLSVECPDNTMPLPVPSDGVKVGEIQSVDNCRSRYIYSFDLSTDIPQPRRCFEAVIKSCPVDFPEQSLQILCTNHTAYRFNRRSYVLYKNKYCAQCNGYHGELTCDTGLFWGTAVHAPRGPSAPSYTMLLDFNTGSRTVRFSSTGEGLTNVVNSTCEVGYKFDPYTAKCRFLLCPAGFKLEQYDSKCYLIPNTQPSSIQDTNNQTCPMVRLNASSEAVLLENGTVFVPIANLTLNASMYTISEDGSGVLICSSLLSGLKRNTTLPQSWRNVDDSIQAVMSVVGVVLSMIALIALIVIYGSFQSLQNTPGKCLLGLSSSLLLGQLLFLLSGSMVTYRALCMISGTLMHYSFLSSFCWMNVLAFSIWRTFIHQYQPAQHSKGNSRFIRRAIYAFGMPFIIVSICLVLELTMEPGSEFSPRYGLNICWISNKYVLIATFAVPLAIVILSNAIFFSMAIYQIHRAAVESANIVRSGSSGGGSTRQLILYVKLSTIMGLTWLFGFVANFVMAVNVFWYLFIFFNALQGVFIALGFLLNKKVYRLVKKSVKIRMGADTSESGTFDSKRTTKTQSTSM